MSDGTLTNLDWRAVERLREIFLSGKPLKRAYWESPDDLAAYDATLGERIGWKWDAVLAELKQRGWSPPPGPLLDFGCGSGIAGRRVLAAFGPERFTVLRLHDRSPLAEEFSRQQAARAFPTLPRERLGAGELDRLEPVGTLLVSHVLGELPEADRRQLVNLARRADAVLWVEPGTHADSRALGAVRETLREGFEIVAPCTHQAACGVLAAGNEPHWCHHFAKPPTEAFTDGAWAEFARRLGIDLRSVPCSFLVLRRPGSEPAPLPADGVSRIISAPQVLKGLARVFSCDGCGVRELELQKRDLPALHRAMKRQDAGTLYRWTCEGDRIKQAEAWPEPAVVFPAEA